MDKEKKTMIIVIAIAVVLLVVIAGINLYKTFNKGNGQAIENTSNKNEINEEEEAEVDNKEEIANGENPVATIVVKDFGTMKIELYADKAENTVKNFIALANNGFYNGQKFHRIIEDFMIQGGDPTGTGSGGPKLSDIDKNATEDYEYSINGEFSLNGIDNDIEMTTGTIAMARSDYSYYFPEIAAEGYNSAGSQFFIVTSDNNRTSLEGNYAAFGRLIEGKDVLSKLNSVRVIAAGNSGEKSMPVDDVIIESITVDTKGKEYSLPEVHKKFDINSYYEKFYSGLQ